MWTLVRHLFKGICTQVTVIMGKFTSLLLLVSKKTRITCISCVDLYMVCPARLVHHTMSAYLKSQGCTLVGFERSMWTVVKEGHVILLTAHIDDFIIACADRLVLDEFRTALLQRFEGTYEGEVHTYLGCEIFRDLEAGKTLCLRNIMLKTSYAHMTIGNVFLPSLL